MTPRATYRLQFGPAFGFGEAAGLAPYLAALGVSHVYLAPVFAARPGSTHGYDVTDPARAQPRARRRGRFRAMAAAFRGEGLGLILDIVPNHMGIGGDANPFWLDVLEWGRESRFAALVRHRLGRARPRRQAAAAGARRGLRPGAGGGALELRCDAATAASRSGRTARHKLPVSPAPLRADPARAGRGARRGGRGAGGGGPDDPALGGAQGADRGAREAGAAAGGLPRQPATGAGRGSIVARSTGGRRSSAWRREALNYRRFFAISDLAGSGSRTRRSSRRPTRWRSRWSPRASSTGCASTISTGCATRRPTCAAAREAPRPFWLLVEKILARRRDAARRLGRRRHHRLRGREPPRRASGRPGRRGRDRRATGAASPAATASPEDDGARREARGPRADARVGARGARAPAAPACGRPAALSRSRPGRRARRARRDHRGARRLPDLCRRRAASREADRARRRRGGRAGRARRRLGSSRTPSSWSRRR